MADTNSVPFISELGLIMNYPDALAAYNLSGHKGFREMDVSP